MKLKNTIAILLAFVLISPVLMAQPDEDCYMCHEDPDLTAERYGRTVSMFVDAGILGKSAHRSVDCVSCHRDLKGAEIPHAEKLQKVSCESCHDDFAEQMKNDIHAKLNIEQSKRPDCKSCHSTHNVVSPAFVKDQNQFYCGKCHTNDVLAGQYHAGSELSQTCLECHDDPAYTEGMATSVHANLTCSNCHSSVAKDIDAHTENPQQFKSADCYLCHGAVASEHRQSVHGLSIAEGIDEAAHCWDCHGSHHITKIDSAESMVHSSNIVATCASCHDDPEFGRKFHLSAVQKAYNTSVHGQIYAEMNDSVNAPNCITCHGVHDIKSRVQDGSRISAIGTPETCSECHKKETEEYKNSIHWIAVQKGVRNSPTCNDCHSEHSVSAINVLNKREEAKKMQEETCLRCHESLLLSSRYGLSQDNARSYQDSYHGLAVMRGDEDAAMCIDCHSVHSILPKYHEESTVHESNVVATCQKCHADAGEVFSKSYSHVTPEGTQASFIENIVKNVYVWLIIIVIGGMMLHNLLIFFYELRERYLNNKKQIRIPRFTTNELIQHTILLTSFIILAITGFQLKFPDSWWSLGLTDLGLDEPTRRLVHRISAVVMIVLSIYHVIYLIVTRRGREALTAMFPRLSDLTQAVQNVGYYLGFGKKQPDFDDFNYIEKAEYWALVWGTIVMAVTGFILWFPTIVGDWAPVWFIKVSEIVHYYEAILATLAIIVWHWFFVMFRPKEYPVSLTVVHGKMTIHHYKEEHRLRFRKIMAEWYELKNGRKTKKEISHIAKLFIKAIEKSGVDTDEFLQGEIEKDPELKAMIKNLK